MVSAVNIVKGLLLWVSLLGFCLPALAQPSLPPLAAFVDRTDISINDVITLTVRVDADLGNTKPNFASLNREFQQVGGLETRSTFTMNNGTTQSWTEYSIKLRPLMTGVLTIPAFRIGQEVSSAIRVNVGEATQSSGSGDDEIFLRTTISKNESYVQEQLLYTIRIYWSINFDQGAQLTSPQVADSVVQQLGSDENSQELVNGINYYVTERRFVIFPQASGELTIPPVYFQASIGRRNSFGRLNLSRNQVREINLTSESHTVNVLPRPASFPGNTWLPAAQLTLEESWSGDLDDIQVGDAITRNITLTTQGLSSSLLPAIEYEAQPGLKFYPDQPLREDAADRNGVIGKRSEGTAIVASQPGEFTLPEVRLPWWNTTTNSLEIAVLPARTFTITGSAAPTSGLASSGVEMVPAAGPGGLPGAVPAAQRSGVNLVWITTTVLFAAAWLFSTLMWLRSRRQLSYAEVVQPLHPLRMPPDLREKAQAQADRLPEANACLRVLQTACNSNNLADIRRAAIRWGQASFATTAIQTLEQLAQRCRSERLSTQLAALDAALYGAGGNDFDSKELYAEIAELHKQGVKHDDTGGKYDLPPLYKN